MCVLYDVVNSGCVVDVGHDDVNCIDWYDRRGIDIGVVCDVGVIAVGVRMMLLCLIMLVLVLVLVLLCCVVFVWYVVMVLMMLVLVIVMLLMLCMVMLIVLLMVRLACYGAVGSDCGGSIGIGSYIDVVGVAVVGCDGIGCVVICIMDAICRVFMCTAGYVNVVDVCDIVIVDGCDTHDYLSC